ATLIVNFFRKAKFKDFAGELEESSEIFDLAHTLSDSALLKENLVRVNAILITDGIYTGEIPGTKTISGYPIFFKVADINYLYNISEKTHLPIEIDFKDDGFYLPCIKSPLVNKEYQSYLAIISGDALVNIYERYGARLLEQNVRSFLQFTGKVNSGIRNTILKEPHMFLAFNNGIAATADSVEIEKAENGNGFVITKVSDFQIVNGGQTTASIYHTWKKDKKDVSGIHVQVKLSVVKDKANFSDIVSQISQYANTQNKVSVSDLSSNRPYHIEMEKLSRTIWAPPIEGRAIQTRWFYDRARGQYKNARNKEGFSKAKQNAFDLKNPKSQVFSKEDVAKYINSYQEIIEGKKMLVGPHYVVRGNQKNYVQFMNHNLVKKTDSIYFEDVIAKAILFRATEKAYGVKPNSIGDMRYITVPYSIAYLTFITKGKLDLYKIWKAQSISRELKDLLFKLMQQVENFIKKNAPGSLYGEWAKREECWEQLKKLKLDIDIDSIRVDMQDSKSNSQRKKITEEESEASQIKEELDKLKSISPKMWRNMEEWGKATELLTPNQQTGAWNISMRLKNNNKLTNHERIMGLKIWEVVIEHAPKLLSEQDITP
ncbi:AIPR family protein, partial [Ferruginibacter sp.]|uniref:AIPR family protein n=1 Tax=Ferruginibacter sp. TaxID=1940288 RepID=UPI0019B46849